MFSFLKSKDKNTQTNTPTEPKASWRDRLKAGLKKTRQRFSNSLSSLVLGKKEIDQDLLDDIETTLLSADIGIETSDYIIKTLTDKVARKELSNPEALIETLQTILVNMLQPCEQAMPMHEPLQVILMVGVNGVGKTTSIAKMAHRFQQQGKSVILAAGDTFRAAAVEQLKVWGERNHVPVIAQRSGADSASVLYDAMQSASARNTDILIADTAGRLHTQNNLMEELKKIKRVMGKINADAPHEVMLVIDASLGQNSLNQALEFHQHIGLTSLCITKLDGSAKGGIVFSIAKALNLPIRYIGVGEAMEDLQAFDAKEFVEALFADDSTD